MTDEYCQKCQRDTPTVLLRLSSGHIGNLCALCRTARKGRPYVTAAEFDKFEKAPMPSRAKGGHESPEALF